MAEFMADYVTEKQRGANKLAEAEARGYARGKIDGYKSGVEDAAKGLANGTLTGGEHPAIAKAIRSLLPPGKEG